MLVHPPRITLFTALLMLSLFLVLGVAGEASAAKLAPPAKITVPANDTDGNYVVKWTKSTSTTTGIVYVLQEATNTAFTGARTVPHANLLNASITGRKNGKTYYYRVRATKTGKAAINWTISTKGCVVKFIVKAPGPITVPATDADGSYKVSWRASADTSRVSYVLQEATNTEFIGARTVPHTNLLNATIKGRTPGTTYYYRVCARKTGYRNSAWRTGANGCVVAGNTQSQSFSPVSCGGSSPTERYWRYQINSGTPLSITVEGITMTFNFNNFLLTVNPQTCLREGTFGGSITGTVSGHYSASTTEDLSIVSNKTLVNDSKILIDMQISFYGQSANIAIDLMTDFSPAAEWFLDRSDLDQLAIGYVYDEGSITGTVSGSVSVSGQTSVIPPTSASSPGRWEIVGKQASAVVNGKVYNNIVKVSRTALVPGFDLSTGVANQNMSVIYWVAKGVGMIRGEAYLNFLGNALTVDLVDTNLPL